MSIFWRNSIVAIFWGLITFLIIRSNTSQMFLSLLFTVVVLHFWEDIVEKYFKRENIKKGYAFILSLISIGLIFYALYSSFKMMGQDLGKLIETSQPLILDAMSKFGLEQNIKTVTDFYQIIVDFMKANVGFITFSATLIIKVIIGIILGIVVHFSMIEIQDTRTVWGSSVNIINEQCQIIYKSFRDVMSIQILISLMNTTIISILALGITYIFYGEFLPYWYVIIPLTAILSLVPVVGNILINIVLVLSTIQISTVFVLVGLGLFLIIHKLELIVIGNKMNEKVNVPFIIILFSMVLGELLFHSMSGMMLGMIIMISLSKILKEIKIIEKSE